MPIILAILAFFAPKIFTHGTRSAERGINDIAKGVADVKATKAEFKRQRAVNRAVPNKLKAENRTAKDNENLERLKREAEELRTSRKR
ncbi:MAG: hypothetical protein ABF633_03360 [Clostridium sp.]|uniref:hypothetical protein n=1 Tax=Clostridium sp. TaxID=1506 RepID=UPI0039ED279F